jgi:putative membrane-bound dehydrogenase-like protein
MPSRLTLIAFACASMLGAEPQVDPKDLPRFPALEPSEALKSFVIREGFKIELAASEPNIGSPVALSFDEDGRMYVVEMRDYSEHRDEKLGRIRLLEDTNNDGLFEKSTIFAEGLAWPTAVICYDGGIFVGATPDILFLKDLNGDGKATFANERKVVFTGFGKGVERLNVQQLLNSFQWGLDNRIHGANGGNGGTIEQVASGAPTLRLGTRDFSFDPRTLVMRAETGGGQHGMSFDDFGRKFVSNNSSHIRMQAYEDRYLQGVEGIALPGGMVDNIAREGPAAEVFRVSPEEPWRTIRTKWRVAGQVPGPIEGGGRASGYFTGATGVTIYRGDAFPPEFHGNAFVGDAGGNLIHRKIIETNGVIFEAHRAHDELNREFLASRDTWFRPIQFANAPDGCLYVIDMYREVIEHPWSIPPTLKKLIDLDSGRERGRIWRIAPKDRIFRRSAPRLGAQRDVGLVKILQDENGWRRDTAQRMLYQRNATNAADQLKDLLRYGPSTSRAHALGLLASFKQLTGEDVATALRDPNPAVVERALISYESLSETDRASIDLNKNFAAYPPTPRLAFQLAWTLSATAPRPNPRADKALDGRTKLLLNIINEHAADPYIRAAALVAARERAEDLFSWLARPLLTPRPPGVSQFIEQLASLNVDPHTLNIALGALTNPGHPLNLELGAAIADALKARNIESSQLPKLLEMGRALVTDSKRPDFQVAALRALKHDDSIRAKPVFTKAFIDPNADEVRIEAFRLLSRNLREASDLLWQRWPELPTRVRQSTLDHLIRREEGMLLIIEALKSKHITRGDLTASQTQTLRQGYNPKISRPALELLGNLDTDRAKVIEKFRPALEKSGDRQLGEKLFIERCATCHRYAGNGLAVGPDLESVTGNGREYLLTHILDPNREVNTRFVAYNAELRDGDTISGILARETDSEVTLRLANAEEKTIPRSQIKSLKASAQSLMPVGLEDGLDVQAMAGLLDYLRKAP